MSVADQIHQAVLDFAPTRSELVNESANHAGYFEGKESHFRLTIVSETFADMPLRARHQAVYRRLSDLLTQNGGSVHALALHTYTPDEWQATKQTPESPNCLGRR